MRFDNSERLFFDVLLLYWSSLNIMEVEIYEKKFKQNSKRSNKNHKGIA